MLRTVLMFVEVGLSYRNTLLAGEQLPVSESYLIPMSADAWPGKLHHAFCRLRLSKESSRAFRFCHSNIAYCHKHMWPCVVEHAH